MIAQRSIAPLLVFLALGSYGPELHATGFGSKKLIADINGHARDVVSSELMHQHRSKSPRV